MKPRMMYQRLICQCSRAVDWAGHAGREATCMCIEMGTPESRSTGAVVAYLGFCCHNGDSHLIPNAGWPAVVASIGRCV